MFKKKYSVFPVYFLFGVAVGVFGLFFSFHLVYAKAIIPGVSVAGVSIGGLEQEEATSALREVLIPAQKEKLVVDLVYPDSSRPVREEILPGDLGLFYQIERSVEEAYSLGRSGDFWADSVVKWRTWSRGTASPLVYKLNEETYLLKLQEVVSKVGVPARNARFSLSGERVIILPSSPGLGVDSEELEKAIIAAFLTLERSPQTFFLQQVNPILVDADLQPLLPKVSTLVASPPTLEYEGQVWQPTSSEILSFLTVSAFSPPRLRVVEEKVAEYVSNLSRQVNRSPKGQILEAQGDRVVRFEPSQSGLALKQDELVRLYSQALLGSERVEAVTLPVEVIEPTRDSNQFGVVEKIGTGTTNFKGSSANRVFNIQRAAGVLNGVLIPPGETFSLNAAVGEVSKKTGYKEAYVISKGRTVMGYGGGLCQIATTVYRAALYSGLPIVERKPHDYRVHYYEPPTGMDATVYSPSPDFRFKNDTPAYVLVQSRVDVPTQTLEFSFYGTSDGRKVEITEPLIAKVVSSPPPRTEETDTLAKGEVKKVEWAVPGADVTVYRTVTKGSEILHQDTFFSHYQAWGEVVLVGIR